MKRLLLVVTIVSVVSQTENLGISKYVGDVWRSEAIFWLDALSRMGHPKIPKSLSLEGYFTNQSHALEDLFLALSSCVNADKELRAWKYVLSVNSDSIDKWEIESENRSTSSEIKYKYPEEVRVILIPARFIEFLLDERIGWARDQFILILAMPDFENEIINLESSSFLPNISQNILMEVWTKFGILNVFIGFPLNPQKNRKLLTFDPFHFNKSTHLFGEFIQIDVGTAKMPLWPAKFPLRDLHGYKLKIGIFDSSPSTPRIVNYGKYESIDNFYGIDGLVLATLAKKLNFSVHTSGASDGIEYGYFSVENQTFCGTLGDIATRRIDASFNSQYLKLYAPTEKDSKLIEFTIPVDCDQVCIVVPSAAEIPRWLRTFHYFHPAVWASVFLSLVLVSLVWYILQKQRKNSKTQRFYYIFFETFMLFVGAPVKINLPEAEKMLIGAHLLLGLTIIGAFTGTLYHTFTHRMFYSAINDLEQLDSTGLIIETSTPSLLDIFGTEDDEKDPPVIRRLRKKMKFVHWRNVLPRIEKVAYQQNIAAVRRASSFNLAKYHYFDGSGVSRVHMVPECPQTYYLAYLIPKNSVLVEPFNRLIIMLREAGFIEYWRIETIRDLIHHELSIQNRSKNLEEPTPFNLQDLQTSFMILFIGLFFSTIIFICELIFKPQIEKINKEM